MTAETETIESVRAQIVACEQQLAALREKLRALAAEAITKVAREAGLGPEDVAAIVERKPAASRPRRGVLAPKYRDPVSGRTWSGKGRKPAWVHEHIERGGSLDELAVA